MTNRLPGKLPSPRVDLIERASDYRLFLELPGSAVGDVQLEIENGVLRLTSLISQSFPLESGVRPGPTGRLELSVDFGDLLSGDDLQAVQQRGVLLVTLPKA
jgi:HSP20 family molecular chaperone IbpA